MVHFLPLRGAACVGTGSSPAPVPKDFPNVLSLDQESADLNAYLFAEKGSLADLAEAVWEEADAASGRPRGGSWATHRSTKTITPRLAKG